MSEQDDVLLESALTAHRERDAEGRLVPPASWWDLAPEALDALYREQLLAREIERHVDPAGRSGTVRAVMSAIDRRL